MIISVWRYSHLALAVSSFLLLTLASVTGIMLAFEPIAEKSQNFYIKGTDTLPLSQVVPAVTRNYKDVQKLSRDDNGFVILDWTNSKGAAQKTYINPVTAAPLGPVAIQKPFFRWATALHRSLFIHETGRFLVALASFLLILIALSGIILVIQRQKNILRFFARIERVNWAQYYHVLFGRIALFPILVIAITGTYLSITRFEWVDATEAKLQFDADNLAEDPQLNVDSFVIFRQTYLENLQSLEFPFSDFPEDYYTLRARDGISAVNQFTGDIIASQQYSKAAQASAFSLRWHTGRNGIAWAIILAISSAYILFFIYSGFVVMFRRRASVLKNRYSAEDCEVVILVGSENGSTLRFARSVYQQVAAQGKKVFLTDPDNYRLFPSMKQLIVMTSTYGLGDPPSNARHFARRLEKYAQPKTFGYSVLAFGSRTYADYCKFGLEVDVLLGRLPQGSKSTQVFTVNDRSPEDFNAWCLNWSQQVGITVNVTTDLLKNEHHDQLQNLTVTGKTVMNQTTADDTFIICFKTPGKVRVRSGDLLAIYPAGDHRERLYSIAIINDEIQLCVKYHAGGLGSGFLNRLEAGSIMPGRILRNEHFHFPAKAPAVLMISNGTGIAPFLGMIDANKKKIPVYLYCGFRFESSFVLYERFLNEQKSRGQLKSLHVALSREGNREYIMNRLSDSAMEIAALLAAGGVVMICGSLAMQKDVLQELARICSIQAQLNFDDLHLKGRILTDCY
jgi:sulfite reductase (NADPH) flavoprotein alpha-component